MGNTFIHHSERLYGFLLQLYPARYKQEFGEEMRYVFTQSLKEAVSEQGLLGAVTLWTGATTDFCLSLIKQHLDSTKEGGFMTTKTIARPALVTGVVLLVPLVATLVTEQMNWDETDFIIMGVLIFGITLVFELITQKVTTTKNRVLVGLGLLGVLLSLWAELAVGIFTNWGS